MNIFFMAFDDAKKAQINAGKIKIKVKKVGFSNAHNLGGISITFKATVTLSFSAAAIIECQFKDFNNYGLQSGETYGTLTGWDTSTTPAKMTITPASVNYAGVRTSGLEYEFIDFFNNKDYFINRGDGTYALTQKMADIINGSISSPNAPIDFFNSIGGTYFSLINSAIFIGNKSGVIVLSYSKFISVAGSAQNFYQPSNKDTGLISVGSDSIIKIGCKASFGGKTAGAQGNVITPGAGTGTLFKNAFEMTTETADEKAERRSYFQSSYIQFNFEYSELDATQ